ncbi:DUF3592 domain-containing protein [Streptomyces sp. NBC_00038]|uniref:DUF3592 domain-containing protein n=1 Tax=Streptomyces sp. NBC_00038 TaxID=2903615 RepID=UPI00224FE7BC|nr:DUF3592 domain-containing protein [Streptomyces sp. NBC_00038]MCX5560461.1 DUF3592 domain-containing protein [Streptomyces sp. NBC_00038]
MGWHGYLALWCGVFGAVALIGYGRSLAGVTRAQRTVRVVGRIEQVREPRQGSSRKDGIFVVVSFHDPSTGQEFTVTSDGEHGETITTAWTGREIGIHYPPGRPHAHRFTSDLWGGRYGLVRPNCAVFLIYAGLVAVAAIDWGWPWALIGFGVPWTVSGAYYVPANARETSRRIDMLTTVAPVPGRVIAVLKDVSVDADDGHVTTSHTPVVTFTTHEGTAVTAYWPSGLTVPAGAHGRDVTIHYAPDDPAVFTPALADEHHSRKTDLVFGVLALLTGVAAVAVGAVML